MKRAIAGAFALGLAALVASMSCATFDYPNGTCPGDRFVKDTAASKDTKALCGTCIQEQCCDRVGQCQDQGASCTDPVRAMYDCVVDGGPKPSVEAKCGPALASDDQARTTYTCMRDRCGAACGLPSCHVDPAALLVIDSKCDRCFSDACCGELNACYQNRACKLTVECIVTRCKNELSAGLASGFRFGIANVDLDQEPLCTNPATPVAGAGGPDEAKCVFDCIQEFGDNDPTAAIDPHKGAKCLSTKIYQCAVKAGCAETCAISPPDAGVDGG